MPVLSRLREVRERRALSQGELAALAGVNRNTVLFAEACRIEPQPRTVRKLATALGVEPHELMAPEPDTRR